MNLVINNPYRIVGLLVGATAREQERQLRRLKQYIDAGEEPDDDFSFPILGAIHRTVDSVNEVASKLNLDKDKLNAALFWFYNGYDITDEPAFDALKSSDINRATDIWSNHTKSGEVTQKNHSAFHNLSTILLCTGFRGSTINIALFEQGLGLKLKFLESDFVNVLKTKATDETFKTTKKEIQIAFLTALQQELEKRSGITPGKFIEILSKQNFSAKEDFLKGYVQKPIEQIEKKIEAAKTKRKANKANGGSAGKELYDSVNGDMMQLKNILGTSNLRYSSIADKVSDEILQCGIDYFLHYRDTNTDPGSVSMDLFKKSKIFAVGNIAKQRCQENTDNLQEWINEKPERDKQVKVQSDLDELIKIFQEYDKRAETIENAKSLIKKCKPKLSNIKNVLGSSDELYLKLSTRVAQQAQSFIVEEVNDAQENLEYKIAVDRYGTINKLKSTLSNAWSVTNLLGTLDMEYEFKTKRYNTNKKALKELCNQLGVSTSSQNTTSSSNSPTTYSPPSPPSTQGDSSSNWPIWIIVAGAIMGFLSEGFGGLFIGGFIGFILVGLISKIID